MMFDATAYTGHWPFRHIRKQQLSQLIHTHQKNGIHGGVVSSLNAIFYNDPGEGDELLAAELPKEYKLAVTHNPLLPWAANDAAKNELGAVATRIYPCYHGYNPCDGQVVDFCRAAAAAGLVIYVVGRMDDIRLDYLVQQKNPPVEELLALAEKVPEGRFVLSGMKPGELATKGKEISALGNVWVDTAFAVSGYFPYDNIGERLPIDKVLFGTMFPLQCMESNTFTMEHAEISPQDKAKITGGNAKKLFGIDSL